MGQALVDLVRDSRILRPRLTIGAARRNIVEMYHLRLFGSVIPRSTELDLKVETRDRDHAREPLAALQAEGLKVRVLEGRKRKLAAARSALALRQKGAARQYNGSDSGPLLMERGARTPYLEPLDVEKCASS